MPALLIMTSRPPRLASAACRNRLSWASSATSVTVTPTAGCFDLKPFNPDSSTSQTSTLAPAARNISAVTRPIPVAAAVMMTRLFCRPVAISSSSLFSVHARIRDHAEYLEHQVGGVEGGVPGGIGERQHLADVAAD